MPVALKKEKLKKPAVLAKLNLAQKKAVTYNTGPLLIVAGAGTGKTTVITNRLAWLIESKKAKPEEILALTFTDKAADEMEERVDRLLPLGYLDLWVSTFHSFGERILREHALEIGLDPGFKLLSAAEQWIFIRENLFKFDLDYYRPLGNPTRFIYALVQHFSRAKDEALLPDGYAKQAKKIGDDKLNELAGAYRTYQSLLQEAGYMDFGDLILNTLELFKKRPAILKKYQQQFKYSLVDEFQDTNYAQYELIRFLARPKNNITVVGDDDQSIYKFRGAAISNILNFKKDYHKAKEIVLTDNYRSTQPILDAAYSTIQLNNPDRLEVKLGINKKLVSDISDQVSGRPRHLHYKTAEEEARGVVDKIIKLKENGSHQSPATGHRPPVTSHRLPVTGWDDFAILVRANNQAEPFIEELARRDIPFEFLASKGLYSRPEVIDLISYLKLLNNPDDNVSAVRLLHSPLFKFNSLDIARVIQESNRYNISVTAALQKISDAAAENKDLAKKFKPETITAAKNLLALLESQAKLVKEKTAGEILFRFAESIDLFNKTLGKGKADNIKRINNISQFFRRIQNFERAQESESLRDKSLRAFVHELDMMLEAGEDPAPPELEEGPETVKVMTIHGAKGLEFDTVFLVNLVRDRFPARSRGAEIELPVELAREDLPRKEDHLQEERRLFYVALTRAKRNLFLTTAEDYGGVRKKKPSVFLGEVAGKIKGVNKSQVPSTKFQTNPKSQAPNSKTTVLSNAKLALPGKFSYTQITAFANCPKQYRLAHVLRIPVLGSHTLSYGKSIHATLADLYSEVLAKRKPSLEFLEERYKKNWRGEWYETKKHEEKRKKQGLKALREYYEKNKKYFGRVKYVEQEFNLKIGQFTLKGFIDRIDKLPDGSLEIIDYKTGSAEKKDEKKLAKDLQLAIYALAARDVFKTPASKLSLYFIDDNKKISVSSADQDLDKVKKEVEEALIKITQSDFKATPGYLCRYCDFLGMCAEGQREVAK